MLRCSTSLIPRVHLRQDFGGWFAPLGILPEPFYAWSLRTLPFPPVTAGTITLRDRPGTPAGLIVMVPLGARQMLELPGDQVVQRVDAAVDHAVRRGAQVVGLGALTASVTAGGACDAVSIARGLVANNDLVQQFAQGRDRPEKPCSYCNRCMIHVLADPFGCYDVSRYDGDHERMISEVMSVFEPSGFEAPAVAPYGGQTITLRPTIPEEAQSYLEPATRL